MHKNKFKLIFKKYMIQNMSKLNICCAAREVAAQERNAAQRLCSYKYLAQRGRLRRKVIDCDSGI